MMDRAFSPWFLFPETNLGLRPGCYGYRFQRSHSRFESGPARIVHRPAGPPVGRGPSGRDQPRSCAGTSDLTLLTIQVVPPLRAGRCSGALRTSYPSHKQWTHEWRRLEGQRPAPFQPGAEPQELCNIQKRAESRAIGGFDTAPLDRICARSTLRCELNELRAKGHKDFPFTR